MNDEKLLPNGEQDLKIENEDKKEFPKTSVPGMPSQSAQSWGVLISIIIIVLMITVGAFYAWGKRIAQGNALTAQSALNK